MINIFSFCSWLRSIRNRDEGKMEVLFKSLIISSKVRMTSEIVKKQRSLKKGTLNLVYKEELLFGKSKEPDNVRVFKTQSGNKF